MTTMAPGQDAEPFWEESQDRDAAISLEELAGHLGDRGYHAELISSAGRRPRLQVRNPDVPMLTEEVYAESGWYWYAFAERIVPAGQPDRAAAKIAHVLHAVGAR